MKKVRVGDYQHSAKASKNSAFNWKTWKSECAPMTAQEASAERLKVKRLTPGLTEPENKFEADVKKPRRSITIAPRDPCAAMKVGRLTKAAI